MVDSTLIERRLRKLSIACGVFSLVFCLAGYLYGVRHHFDHWMAQAIEYQNVKVAAALTNHVYGIQLKRAAHTEVWEALRQGGMTFEPAYLARLGTKFPDNMSNVDLLNGALKKASQLGPLRPPVKLMSDIKPTEPDDTGAVEFYALAFKIFGINIQGFYRLYALIYAVSVGLFIVGYWRSLPAMSALLVFTASYFFALGFLAAPKEMAFGVFTPYDQRFVSALGLVSALHVVLAMLWLPRRTLLNVALLSAQVALVFFVYIIRRTALWEILWMLFVPVLFLGLIVLWRFGGLQRWPKLNAISPLVERSLSWPALVLIFLMGVGTVINAARTNPIYRFSDEFMPQHTAWNAIFLSLAIHPKWVEVFGHTLTRNGQNASSDDLTVLAAESWLMQNYGLERTYILSPVSQGLRNRTVERVQEEAFLSFARAHKRFMLELHLYYKPRLLLVNYLYWTEHAYRNMPWWALILIGGAVALYLYACRILGMIRRESRVEVLALIVGGALMSIIPAVLIASGWSVMSDQAIMINAALVCLLGTAVAFWNTPKAAKQIIADKDHE